MRLASNLLKFLEEVKTFDELENKLAKLTNDKEKGDLFELFCQTYLKVIYKKQVFKSVHLFRDIDATTLKKLNLRIGKDYGIDIVATTDSDELWTIQVKFRQSDQLTWTELSTFRASSEKAAFTMLMSNVSKINHPHAILTDFSSILRNEFEILTEYDFSNIKSALRGQAIKLISLSPRPHQVEAINAAIDYFKTKNLGQMIHACGTGKTLTSLWIKEALKPKNTIVYVPSLSLLKQILEEYTKNRSFNFSIKCVCSDQSVSRNATEMDETIVDVTELGVPVTTNPKEISDFLISSEREKIIFSTYQSAPVIIEAMKSLPGFSFDFGVFDEAHRTASKSEHLFAKSLNTPIVKKLFMTATPKLYAPHLKTRAKEEEILLCSMDDSSLYGEVFHEIKFGEAIKLNLLSNYKIKIITVTNDEIKELIDRRYWIDLLGKEITADELAKVWALLKSFNEASHVISFHSRISGAREFQSLVEKTIELLKSHKRETENVKTYHISGEYPTYQRSKILSEFIQQKKSLVTNARCLTEGIDVPAIDGVYFVDPKQNIIDIVQAVGRAIRKKSTQYGYIVIPVFIKDETDTEKIIESSAFRQVWDVVEAMKDQDTRLNHIIEELQELNGKKRFGGLKSREQAEERALKADLSNIFDLSDSILPKNINILEFVEQIGVKTLDIVGQSWDQHFGEYKAFKEKYGRDPLRDSEDAFENKLSYWVGTQRSWNHNNRLSKKRFDKLNSIGFNWGIVLNEWDERFEEYKEFIIKSGRLPSETSKDKFEASSSRWAVTQRTNYKKKKLSKERIEKLNSINFIWDLIEDKWENSSKNYQKFKKENGKEPVFRSSGGVESDLAVWAGDQRERFKANKIANERIDKLNSIGFSWDIKADQWEQSFNDYKNFKIKHGREPSTASLNKFEEFIAHWAIAQRIEYSRNKILKERKEKLNSIKFIWSIKEDRWEQAFEKYKIFKKENNREPSNKSKDKPEREIGKWITHYKVIYNKNKLPEERINKLNSVGIIWDQKNDSWEQNFSDYKKFKDQYKKEPIHTSKDKFESDIAKWITRQRKAYKKDELSSDRAIKLDSIGFKWDIKKDVWNDTFEDYKNFKIKYGREPSNVSEDKPEVFLAHWVQTQRGGYGRDKRPIPKERVNKLNSINFVWKVKDDRWNDMFKDYISFKRKFGREPSNHTKIEPEASIGRWANVQRQNYKKDKISEERRSKLEDSGFQWSLKK